jgi:hypothetical protein
VQHCLVGSEMCIRDSPNCVPIEGKTMDFAEFELLKEQLNTLRVALD